MGIIGRGREIHQAAQITDQTLKVELNCGKVEIGAINCACRN